MRMLIFVCEYISCWYFHAYVGAFIIGLARGAGGTSVPLGMTLLAMMPMRVSPPAVHFSVWQLGSQLWLMKRPMGALC